MKANASAAFPNSICSDTSSGTTGHFPISETVPMGLIQIFWAIVEADAQFLAGREENKVSIFWDNRSNIDRSLYEGGA